MRTAILLICAAFFEFAPAAERPNVVFILADDLGYGELGCYGQEKIPTPNIDRLAVEGTRFTRHYSGAPVCAPSRCVLLTGKHLGRAEIRGNRQAKVAFPEFKEGQHPISAGALTIAEVFRDAGYATAAMGKWGLGPVGSTGDPNDQGFDLFFGYNCQAVAHSFFPRYLWRNRERVEINKKPVPGHLKKPEGEVKLEDYQGERYAPYLMIEEAEKWIADHKDRPFFLYLPFIEPHVAMHPPVEAVERFPEDWDDEVYRGQCGYLPHPRPRAGYAAMIHDLDRYVGRVMAALEKAGVADETIVVFTSDNGTTHEGAKGTHFHIGGVDATFFDSTLDLRSYKGSVYEGGLRVPMIVRYPGEVKAGAVSDAPGYFADWFPTLCEAAGLDAPDDLDGESLWPVITGGKTPPARKPMVWTFAGYGGQCAVMMGNMKAIRLGLSRKKPGEWQLYDVVADRGETKDLAEEQPEWIRKAEQILGEQMIENPVFPLRMPGGGAVEEKRR
ncbi:arylsulfatase [Haloferula sp. A504]|uniref:arylsulfatase n=1 Tax=Haloferula sp. A504 TaxID=3373601 RepID=UPI0031C75DF1|nr:arylsulfatase [Verrucomicrobiaceae bacterium E54]